MNFKVGDKVRITDENFKGKVGLVKDLTVPSCSVVIEKEYLEKIEEPNTVNCTIAGSSVSQWEVPQQQYHPSRRDYLIGKIITSHGGPIFSDPQMIAEKIVKFVDALIAELDKTEKK